MIPDSCPLQSINRAASALLLAIASATTKIVSVSNIVMGTLGLSFETGLSFPVTFRATNFFIFGAGEFTGDKSPEDNRLGLVRFN